MHGAHRRLCQEPLESRMLLSVSPAMIDLDSASYSNPSDFVTIGDSMYFAADDTDHGRELWVTDGTEQGTQLVKDINDGATSANPTELIEFDGKLFFVADNGQHGAELWMSDGTAAGTVMVADINAGGSNSDSSPRNLTVVDGAIYFSANDGDHGVELWKTNGVDTTMVKDIFTGTTTSGGVTSPNSSTPSNLINVGGTLFFVANDGENGLELWTSDGTSANTVMVTDINSHGNAFDADGGAMVALGDTLFFVANDSQHGYELWKSDGTEAGTTLVKDIRQGLYGAFSIDNTQIAVMDGILYFAANDGIHGDELWRSDGTTEHTYLLKDINPGAEGELSDHTSFTVMGSSLYFSADDGQTGKELWKTDGTTSGTVLVKDISTGTADSEPYYMKVVGDALYFTAHTQEYGRELWVSDGTETGTVLIDDTVKGPNLLGLYPDTLQSVGDYLIFTGYVSTERELFSLDLATTVRMSIWVDGQEVEIPTNIGVYANSSTADYYTTDSNGTIQLTAGNVATIGDFFNLWQTNAGIAGNEADAIFDNDELMGHTADSDYTVYMFVDGMLCTDFENYVFRGGEEIVLAYSDNTLVSINTNYGPIVMELFDDETPNTVDNFLEYINDGDFINSIFHRSISNFIIQGGNSTSTSPTYTSTSQFSEITDNGTIAAELGISNLRGTVAMARVGTDMSSASNNFFINIKDNTDLDTQDGGYTVFGQVLDMTAADIINDLPIHDTGVSPYTALPYDDATNKLVVVESVEGMGTVTGYKFYDDNDDGIFDSDESGIEGVTVFVDANENGLLDYNEISTTTDADGKYVLHVEAGEHVVRAIVTHGNMATIEYLTVTVDVGEETNEVNFGETELPAPTGVVLASGSDTGTSNSDSITYLNNADAQSTLKFIVSGALNGTEVHLYAYSDQYPDGIEIGVKTATGTSVEIETNGIVALEDGVYEIKAFQTFAGGTSDMVVAEDVLTIDTQPPGDFVSEFVLANINFDEDFTYNANSPDESDPNTFYSLFDAPAGMAINPDTGVISWEPNSDQTGPHLFKIVLSDTAGNTVVQSASITVLGDFPAYSYEHTVLEDQVLNISADNGLLKNHNNIEGIVITKIDEPSHGSVSISSDGSFTYTPDPNFFGTDSFTYKLTQDGVDSNVAMVSITVVGSDDPPVGVVDTHTMNEDGFLFVDADEGVLSNDSDVDGDTLTATIVTGPSHGSIVFNEDGSFAYTPDDDFNGVDSFTYALNDGTSVVSPIEVEINVTPVDDDETVVDDFYEVAEDGSLTVIASEGVLINDINPDNETLTASVSTNPSHGTVSMNANGSFTYTPNEDFSGTDTFTYYVTANGVQSNKATVTITVVGSEDDPVAEDDEFEVENNGTAHVLDALGNDYDPDPSDTITIDSVTQGSNGGTVSINDNKILYTPASGFTGTETFTYTIEDEDGNEATATVTMTVLNDDGIGDGDLSGHVFIDKDNDGHFDSGEIGIPGVLITLTGTSNAGNNITQKRLTDDNGYYVFDDLPAGTYTLTESQPEILADGKDSSSATGATVENDVISEITLADDEAFDGNDFGESTIRSGYVTFRLFLASTFEVSDYLRELVAYGENKVGNTELAKDIIDGGSDYHEDDNHAPVALANTYTSNEDATITIGAATGLLANDSDEDGDTMVASLVTGVSHGTLSLHSDGSFEYSSNANFFGTDSFTYIAYDGISASEVVVVTINVNPINDAPVGEEDVYAVVPGGQLNIAEASGVLANDTDVDEDELEVTVVDNVNHGSLALDENGSFVYTPTAGYHGHDSFTYKIDDGTVESGEITVTIDVNHSPTTEDDDEYSTTQGEDLVVQAVDSVLSNDNDEDEDDTLTAILTSNPQHGTLDWNDDGTFTYTPNAGFTGDDYFTYIAEDGFHDPDPDEATVKITVEPAS